MIPHPYDIFRRSVLTDEAIERVKHDVDAIEGFNCRNILGRHDEKARSLATSVDKPFTLKWDGGSAQVVIRDVQMNHLGNMPVHIDFYDGKKK